MRWIPRWSVGPQAQGVGGPNRSLKYGHVEFGVNRTTRNENPEVNTLLDTVVRGNQLGVMCPLIKWGTSARVTFESNSKIGLANVLWFQLENSQNLSSHLAGRKCGRTNDEHGIRTALEDVDIAFDTGMCCKEGERGRRGVGRVSVSVKARRNMQYSYVMTNNT